MTTQEATALTNAIAAAANDAELLDALTTVVNAGGENATRAAQSIGPQADSLGGLCAATIVVGGQVGDITKSRLALQRRGEAYAQNGFGFAAAGDGLMAGNAWIRPFASIAEQDANGGIAGCDIETFGGLGGLDWAVGKNSRVGASISYAHTQVAGDGPGQSKVDIDSYQSNLYGDFQFLDSYVE